MKVINVDRIDEKVIVTFEDGTTVLYSDELLHEMIPKAHVVPPADPEPKD